RKEYASKKKHRPKHIHPEAAIHERRLQAKYPTIWRSINELGLSYVFRNSGETNVNLVREFYAGFDPEDSDQLVPIRGRLLDFSASAICNFLGAPHFLGEPLDHFIVRPTYRELRHTFCGVNSVAAWVRDKKTNHHRKFPKKNMKIEAQVWLKLINSRLLPCNHDTLISRERTCVFYLLMTGQRVNVGHLIHYHMTQVRTRKKIDRMPFVNMLTQYLRQEEVEEEKEFDHIIAPPLRLTDHTNVRVKEENTTISLTGAERNTRDDSFIAYLYGMVDLQLRIGGRRPLQRRGPYWSSGTRLMLMPSSWLG
ncbi:hypothetical protein A4A49_53502, partial [Nicotiana attenuata]